MIRNNGVKTKVVRLHVRPKAWRNPMKISTKIILLGIVPVVFAVAAAVGTPVVAMFGPTTRHWGFFPEGDRHKIIELHDPNRPYSLHGKTRSREVENCMQGVAIRTVFNAVLQILAGGTR